MRVIRFERVTLYDISIQLINGIFDFINRYYHIQWFGIFLLIIYCAIHIRVVIATCRDQLLCAYIYIQRLYIVSFWIIELGSVTVFR